MELPKRFQKIVKKNPLLSAAALILSVLLSIDPIWHLVSDRPLLSAIPWSSRMLIYGVVALLVATVVFSVAMLRSIVRNQNQTALAAAGDTAVSSKLSRTDYAIGILVLVVLGAAIVFGDWFNGLLQTQQAAQSAAAAKRERELGEKLTNVRSQLTEMTGRAASLENEKNSLQKEPDARTDEIRLRDGGRTWARTERLIGQLGIESQNIDLSSGFKFEKIIRPNPPQPVWLYALARDPEERLYIESRIETFPRCPGLNSARLQSFKKKIDARIDNPLIETEVDANPVLMLQVRLPVLITDQTMPATFREEVASVERATKIATGTVVCD